MLFRSAADYQAFLTEIKNQNIPLFIVDKSFDLDLGGGASLQFLFPSKSFANVKVSELNDTSIVNRLVYDKTSFLFTGDIGLSVEKTLVDNLGSEKLASNALKISHHGSKFASGEEFLTAVSPQYTVISVGVDNDFGHPQFLILSRLQRMNIQYFRTDEQGMIEFDSDGERVEHIEH